MSIRGLSFTLIIILISTFSFGESNVLNDSIELSLKEVVFVTNTDNKDKVDKGILWNTIDTKRFYSASADLAQTLKSTTGLKIREEGGMGSDYKLSLNGFTGKQVKIFMDGLPLDNAGSSVSLNNLPVNMAESIEVYKGISPVELGSDILGGAINIVTRKEADYLDFSFTGGSFNTQKLSLNTSFNNKTKGFLLRSMFFLNRSDNDYKVFVSSRNLETGASDNENWYRRFHDEFKSAGIQFQTGIYNKPWADLLLFSLLASGNMKDIQNGVVMEDVYGMMKSKGWSVIPGIQYKKNSFVIKDLDLKVQTSLNRSDFQITDTSAYIFNWAGQWKTDESSSNGSKGGERSRSRNKNSDLDWVSTILLNYKTNKADNFSLNLSNSVFYRESYDPENPLAPANLFPSSLNKFVSGLNWTKSITDFNFNLFAKSYFMSAKGYKLADAFTENEREEEVRYNYFLPGFGGSVLWNLARNNRVRFSFERTNRMPDSNEIFGDGVFVVYSSGLKPERSNNLNIGYNFSNDTKIGFIGLDMGLIYRMTYDYIRLDQSVSGGNRTMQNKGKVETMGFETEVSYKPVKSFRSVLNFTWQNITDRQEFESSGGFTGGMTKNVTYGFRLPNIPVLFGNANLGYDLNLNDNKLSVDFDAHFTDEYYLVYSELGTSTFNDKYIIPGQFSQDLRLTWSKKGLPHYVSVECRNLTNQILFDSYRLQKPGRSIMVTYRYNITFK